MDLRVMNTKRFARSMLIAVCALLLSLITPFAAMAARESSEEVERIKVRLDGKDVRMTDPVRIQHNRMYMPVAQMAGMFGAQVEWDPENEEATLHTQYDDVIVFGNGVPVVYFNGGRYKMDAAPLYVEGRLYVPLRDTAELLHARVSWDEGRRILAFEAVPLPAAPQEVDVKEADGQAGGSGGEQTLKRHASEVKASVAKGAELRVVVPSVLEHEAEPFTEADLQLLARITQVEAGYESYESQLAVANVILNRVKDSRFPDTIRDVIYSGKQFPPAHNGLLDKSVAKAVALRAAKDALNGKNNVPGAVYFYNPRVTKGPFWSGLTTVATVGSHRFAK